MGGITSRFLSEVTTEKFRPRKFNIKIGPGDEANSYHEHCMDPALHGPSFESPPASSDPCKLWKFMRYSCECMRFTVHENMPYDSV